MKNFIIQINKYKENDNQPDYRIVAKDGEEFVEIGGGWKKKDKNNSPYISCSLKNTYQDKAGYEISTEMPSNSQNDPLDESFDQTRPNTPQDDEVIF